MTTAARAVADVRAAVDREEVLALEAVAARSFPALESERRGGWLLRASRGWTRRGNSALPLAGLDGTLDRLDEVRRWYAARDLPVTVALPVPLFDAAAEALRARGWCADVDVDVLVAGCGDLLDEDTTREDLPAPATAPDPDGAWWTAAADGGRPPPSWAREMLVVPGARFLSIRTGDGVVAVARAVLDGPWVGVSAMRVAPAWRRRGMARHLLRAVAREAREQGAERVWLQVERANVPAVTAYRGAGFRHHHSYRYYHVEGGA